MAKVLCVLYDDPVDGYPKTYARDDIPKITNTPMVRRLRRRAPSISSRASCSAASRASSGFASSSEKAGHTLVVTSDKDGPNSTFEKELPDAEVVISQPFWPAYHDEGALRQGEEAQARHHRRHRLRSYRSPDGDGQGCHRRRGDLLQFDQRLRAHRHDDPGARPQLHPLLRMGRQRRLEHRRLRRALL